MAQRIDLTKIDDCADKIHLNAERSLKGTEWLEWVFMK